MKVLIVNHEEVRRHLLMSDCMKTMEEAFLLLNSGDAENPLRNVIWLPDKTGLMVLMPASLSEPAVMGLKAISVFPGNSISEYDSHQGVVMLFEAKNGRLLALIDATEITAIRTAAVSGVATQLLAREDAGDLAILGAGTQARKHLEAMLVARDIKRVRVWNRREETSAKLADQTARQHGLKVQVVATAQEAVHGANIICTTTSAVEPVLKGHWISPGAHINAVGACTPAARELDTSAVAKSKMYVDRRESALNEAGDFIIPHNQGLIDEGHIIGEIGELLSGETEGRTNSDEITLFKSLGLAIQDLASAQLLYNKLSETRGGKWLELNAKRDE